MPGPSNTLLLIEGPFEELTDELAQYIDQLKKAQGDASSSLQSEVAPLVKEDNKVDALKKLVTASPVLNSAPEKEFVAAYNLLIHLIRQSNNISMFLPKVCGNLSAPITSSPNNGPGLALSILGTIFNILEPDNETRYHVLLTILRVIRGSTPQNFESLKPQLKDLDTWFAAWESEDDEQRKIYLALSDVAGEAGDSEGAYTYLIRAVRTIPADESSSEEARSLALRALKAALTHPSHYDFQDLTALDPIQALRKSDPTHFELLEIFTSQLLDDFNDFKDEHEGWIEGEKLDSAILNRKMRLLTLASLAASAAQSRGGASSASFESRALPYERIAKALQVPAEDVEVWVIDVIRAGLVEGKLSQLNQTFLIHRATYRVFGENQWREVASRLDLWRNSLLGVLDVIRQERDSYDKQREQEAKEVEAKLNGAEQSRGGRRQQAWPKEVEAE